MDELKAFLGVLFLVFLWITTTRDNEFTSIKSILKKGNLFLFGISFMILSKDGKGVGPKYNPDPDTIKDRIVEKKTIIFLRHGESDWNNVFNKGINLSIFSRLFKALFEEFKLIFRLDSKFMDSPLNAEGVEQAYELSHFLDSAEHPEATERTKELFDVINGKSGSSVIVSSNLRRAVATTTVALWHRLKRSQEKIIILSSLQEISRNIDTQALSGRNLIADLPFSRLARYCNIDGVFNPMLVYELSENYGNKTRSFYGGKRLQAFNKWVFSRKESTIIVGGHSLWFKYYFQTYLPYSVNHDSKKKKITNSGVVSFTLGRGDDDKGQQLYRIEPDSITVLYGGFTTK
jgi:hypothetical protein